MSDEERKAFTFFRSYYSAAVELPDKQRLAFYDAIIHYGISGEEIELKGLAKAMFALVKPNLDKSQAKAATGTWSFVEPFETTGEPNQASTRTKLLRLSDPTNRAKLTAQRQTSERGCVTALDNYATNSSNDQSCYDGNGHAQNY